MYIYPVLLPVLLHLADAAYNSGICTQITSQGPAQPPIPTLPDTSEAYIEMTQLAKNSTELIQEYYDKQFNQSAFRQTIDGIHANLYLHFNTNELLTVLTDQRTCTVSNLTASKLRFIFGSDGKQASILQLGTNGTQVYQGQDTVRGIKVLKWYSCQYWKAMDATMNVTWYYSDPTNWDSALGIATVPIRAWVKGHVGSDAGDKPHDFENIYDIYHFVNYITTPDAFQIPDLVACTDSQTNRTFPQLSSSFSMTTEVVSSLDNTISYLQQWFDTKMQLAKHTYRSQQTSDLTSEIHDFNSGVAYVTDFKLGNCTCVPIEKGESDNIVTDPRHVRMSTPREFLQMNIANVTYQGVRTARHISADVYVAERRDYPPFAPVRTIWEWYFTRVNDSAIPPGTLIKMVLYMPALKQSITYNIFDLATSKIDMKVWDISACYNNLPKRIFQFSVPGNYSKIIQVNPTLFKYGVTMSVILLTAMSPLRIANVQLDYSTNVIITFDMLDVPTVAGDVAGNITHTPLNVAADRLTKSFNQFFIFYPYNGPPYNIYAISSSLMELTVGPTPVRLIGAPAATSPTRSTTTTTTTEPTFWPEQSTVDAKTPMPNLPVSFEVHIKRVMTEHNMSTETHEVFDQTSGQLSLQTTAAGNVSLTIINITQREIHLFDPAQKICTVSNLSAGSLDTVIGYTTDKSGEGRIASLAGALVYGTNRQHSYLGREEVRGVSCLKWAVTNVTLGGNIKNKMDIMWYFSDPNTWETALNWPWAPVRATLVGADDRISPGLFYEHIYDFIHFKNFIQIKDAFRTPDFVTCTGRTPKKTFPQIAMAASFTTETLDESLGEIKYIQESFDNKMRLTKYVYTPAPDMNSAFGTTLLTEIHDFNTGVAYVMDNIRGNCTAKPVENGTFDDISKDAVTVRMKTSAQFFYTDASSYSYEGTEMVRDIPSDRFVAKRTDFPSQSPGPSTFEWRFDAGQYSRIQQVQDMYSKGVPLQMKISMPAYAISFTYNIYNYQQAEPSLLSWDIGSCYLNRDRRRFQFTLPETYRKQISTDQEIFKYGAVISLMSCTYVSPLRISAMKLDLGKDIILSFTLLDVAPVRGDVSKATPETTLSTAADHLQTAIQTGNFIIPLEDGTIDNALKIQPISSSLKEIFEGPDVTASTLSLPVSSKPTSTAPQQNTVGSTSQQLPLSSKPTTTAPQQNTIYSTSHQLPLSSKPTSTSPHQDTVRSTSHQQLLSSKPTFTAPQQSTVRRTSRQLPVSTHTVNPSKRTRSTSMNPLNTPFHLPGPTSLNVLCNTNGGGYGTGVVVAVCVVMVVAGGAGGIGVAILLKRKRGRLWNRQ